MSGTSIIAKIFVPLTNLNLTGVLLVETSNSDRVRFVWKIQNDHNIYRLKHIMLKLLNNACCMRNT